MWSEWTQETVEVEEVSEIHTAEYHNFDTDDL